jgi:hypothetical protein
VDSYGVAGRLLLRPAGRRGGPEVADKLADEFALTKRTAITQNPD